MKKVSLVVMMTIVAIGGLLITISPALAIVIPVGPLTMHFTNWETRIINKGQTLIAMVRSR